MKKQCTQSEDKAMRQTLLFCFCGVKTVKPKGKRKKQQRQMWCVVDQRHLEDETLNLPQEIHLYDKLHQSARPGMVYAVDEEVEDGKHTWTVYSSSMKYMGKIANKEVLVRLEADYKAEITHQENEKLEKHEAMMSAVDEHLQPLRDVYHRMFPSRQTAFLAYIIKYMNRKT